jgi:hypothetical protein
MDLETLKMYLAGRDLYVLMGLSVLICAVFIWAGARLVKIIGANILKALLAAILSVAVAWMVRTSLAVVAPLAGPIFGFLIGFLLTLLVIKGVYQASLVRALVVWLFFLLAQPVIAFFIGRSFFGDLSTFFWKGLPF